MQSHLVSSEHGHFICWVLTEDLKSVLSWSRTHTASWHSFAFSDRKRVMAWFCLLIFLYKAAVCQDWLGEGLRRSGLWGHLRGSPWLDPKQMKQMSFGGYLLKGTMCNPCTQSLKWNRETTYFFSLLILSWVFFSLFCFFFVQMQPFLNFVFCLSSFLFLNLRSAHKKTRWVFNEQTQGWRYFNCMFFPPHALFFKARGGCGVFICINNHLSVITLCAHYIVLC